MSFPPNLGITTSLIIDYSTNSSPLFQEFPSLHLPQLDRRNCSPFSRGSKMNGYSRIKKHGTTTRSKSVDFADLSFSRSSSANLGKFKSQERKQPSLNYGLRNVTTYDSIPEDEHKNGVTWEVLGTILGRKRSVSNASFQEMIAEQEQHLLAKTVVKGSMPISRSASVSEGHSRIHNQSDLTPKDKNEDDHRIATESTSQKRGVKKKGKFLKSCKRLFGF